MKTRTKFAILIIALALLVAWYAFRPERLVVNRSVDEAMPTAQVGSSPQPLASGHFYSILHPTEGTATIYQMGDGTRVLRLTSFRTSNGPDVHVYMVASDDAKDAETVKHAGFIDLGSLKGNIGDQNYTLGSDLDLAKYRAVSIWCKRFAVNFGAAPLRPAESSQNRLGLPPEPATKDDEDSLKQRNVSTGVDSETAKKKVLASIGGLPTGRMTTPEEVATLVVMLASPRTANVTGSNYVIDGGLIKTL